MKPSTALAQGGGSQIVSPVIVIGPCHKPILRQEPCVHTPKGAKLAAASSRLLAIPIPLRQRLGLLQRRFAGEGRAKLGKGPDVGLASMAAMFEDAPPPAEGWVQRTLAAHAASLDVLPTDFCAWSYFCEAAIF